MTTATMRSVRIPQGDCVLDADLIVPTPARGMVLFAHGSGSSRHSPRNRAVADTLQMRGLATLLADLLTRDEERVDRVTAHLRFDIELLARRVIGLVDWVRADRELRVLPIGLFGASTGAAAALVAAAERPRDVQAIVSRGGRPDLAGAALSHVQAPTLLLVGSLDHEVVALNREAGARLRAPARLELVKGATHLFEEPGTLDQVAVRAGDWFVHHLVQDQTPAGATFAPARDSS